MDGLSWAVTENVLLLALVCNGYILIAGKGVSQAAKEGSSGIWIHRLGLR